jgi:hypothetical protein
MVVSISSPCTFIYVSFYQRTGFRDSRTENAHIHKQTSLDIVVYDRDRVTEESKKQQLKTHGAFRKNPAVRAFTL